MSVFNIPPAVLTDTTKRFHIPETILSDYTQYLHTDVPNTVFDFRVLKSWYDQFTETSPVMIRAEYFPINWKSKVGNSDMNKNFYTDYAVKIRKGDMVIREDGKIGILNWNIQEYINAQTTQMIECNARVTITRDVPAVTDRYGYVVEEAGVQTIVDDLPCVISEYAGRPDYVVSQNTPGITPDMLTIASMQWNEKTKNVRVNDEFYYGQFKYRVINTNYTEVSIDGDHGVVIFAVRRVAGENK